MKTELDLSNYPTKSGKATGTDTSKFVKKAYLASTKLIFIN